MGKQKKENVTLYCGTTERVAKHAPVAGLNPGGSRVYLSDVYPGLLAFYASTDEADKFGILEIDQAYLDQDYLLPCEWYLEQTQTEAKKKGSREQLRRQESLRKSLDKYHGKWKESLQKLGIVVYDAFIPKKAIRRITIYDPLSNPIITDAIVGCNITLPDYKSEYAKYKTLTRWLVGESVTVEEWMGPAALMASKEDKEQLQDKLMNKVGLDVFYYEPPPKGS